jgi:hypothetical protein
MQRSLGTAACAILLIGLGGCYAYSTAPVLGLLYSDVTGPGGVTSNINATKVGTSTCQSVLGLIASGDCSIAAAAKSAGITLIHHVDYKTNNVLGLFATHTTIVYGQ